MIPQGTISQTCYVTRDIARAVGEWSDVLGAGPFFRIECAKQQKLYRGRPAADSFTAVLGFLGTTMLEFIQPTDDEPSIFREVLDVKGEGVHHVQPNMRIMTAEAYDEQFAAYKRAGLECAVEMEIPGLGRASFFDALARTGVFIELIQASEMMYRGMENMHAAHLAWDGKRPMRDMHESFA
jgi:hypothetical protein